MMFATTFFLGNCFDLYYTHDSFTICLGLMVMANDIDPSQKNGCHSALFCRKYEYYLGESNHTMKKFTSSYLWSQHC